MAFAALIAAYQEAEDGGDRLRALLPMAGRTLLEHQVRRALRAGASHVVVLATRIPPALTTALDRLRRDKLRVELARDPLDAASRLHPTEDVLFVADGLVAPHACFERMAASEPQAVLVVDDVPLNADFERIDADRRWGGLALTDAGMMRETAHMLGEWDLQSTLLRRMVQRGARYLAAGSEAGPENPSPERIMMADRMASTHVAGREMLESDRKSRGSWPGRFIYPPIISVLAPLAIDRGIEPSWLRIGGIMLAAVAAIAFWSGWLWSGMALLLAAGPVAALAHSIDGARLQDRSASWAAALGLPGAQALAMLGLGGYFSALTQDSGYLLAAAGAIVLIFLSERERGVLSKLEEDPGWLRPWIVSGDAAVWLLPLFAMTGQWRWWPLAIAIYAAGSLAMLQETARSVVNRS